MKFNDKQIEQLKKEYAKIDKIDPSGPGYKKLTAMLNKMSQDQLKQLASADVKFVSPLARNRIKESLDESRTVTIPKGVGFWDTTHYPIGGKFDRVTDPSGMKVEVKRTFKSYKGCDTEGTTTDGRKVAFKMSNLKEQIYEAKSLGVAKKVPAKDGGEFVVLHRDTRNMPGSQDKFLMKYTKGGKTKDLGSHPSLEGALKFAKNRGIIEDVELGEVSFNKLDRYRDAAKKDAFVWKDGKPVKKSKTHDKRKRGHDLAFDKQTGWSKVSATKEDDIKRLKESYSAGSLKLDDGSSVKLSSDDAKTLNSLYKNLNGSNKKKMEERMMKNKKSFEEILSFAKETAE